MKMRDFVSRFTATADPIDWQTDATRDGCKVWRLFRPSERYEIDFADEFSSEGWQQFDTDQDAHYFGVWVNPRLLVTLTYAEGDWSLVECPDRESYNREIQRAIDFYGAGQIATVIDPALGTTTIYQQDRSEFLLQEGPR